MQPLTISVLGRHTFFMYDELHHDGPVKVFNGQAWIDCESVKGAVGLICTALKIRYDYSARATPTGFGFLADADGFIIGHANGYKGNADELEFKEYRPFHYTELGLTAETIAADQLAMRVACG